MYITIDPISIYSLDSLDHIILFSSMNILTAYHMSHGVIDRQFRYSNVTIDGPFSIRRLVQQ